MVGFSPIQRCEFRSAEKEIPKQTIPNSFLVLPKETRISTTSCLRAFPTQAIHFQNGRAAHRNTELPIHPKSSRIFHESCAPASPRQPGHLWQLLTRFHRIPSFSRYQPQSSASERRIADSPKIVTHFLRELRTCVPSTAWPSLAAAARFRRSPFLLMVPTLEQRIRTQHCQFSRNRHAFSTRAAHRPALDIVAVFGSCRPIPRSSHKAGT